MYTQKESKIIEQAKSIILGRLQREDTKLSGSSAVKDYLFLQFADMPHEVFCVICLDNQHRVLSIEELFRGTIDGAAVYPREVAKTVLAINAAAIVFAHNHPSGVSESSQADISITRKLSKAMEVLEIRVLDHIVVGFESVTSFAERGLL